MAVLNPNQQVHLDKVTAADEAWREAKSTALARAKIIAAQEVEQYLLRRDSAVRMAIEAEVPGRQLLQRLAGLHTTSPSTLADSLARTAVAAAQEAALAPVDPMAAHVAWNPEEGDFTVTSPEGEVIRLLADHDLSPAESAFPTMGWHDWRRANKDEISRYMGVLSA